MNNMGAIWSIVEHLKGKKIIKLLFLRCSRVELEVPFKTKESKGCFVDFVGSELALKILENK